MTNSRHRPARVRHSIRSATTIISVFYLATNVVHADEPDQLSEIVVTASKRGNESILDVPLAVQAMSGESLEEKGAVDFNDYFRDIPGLSVFDQGPGDKRYIIRGINAAGASAVGLFLDEIVFTDENAQDGGGREPDLRLFDIDRVEVLKGPQGTTFGSSALSGVIRYIPAQPVMNQWDATARVAGTSEEHSGGLGFNGDAAVNAPVIDDRLAVRASGYYTDTPCFINNKFETGVNNDKTWAGRLMATLNISDRSTLDVLYMYQHAETDGNPYYNLVNYFGQPLPPLTQANLVRTGFHDRMNMAEVKYSNTIDAGTFTLVGTTENRRTAFIRDASQSTQVLFGLPSPDAPGVLTTIVEPKDRVLYDIEARFASSFSGPVQLLAGLFAQWEHRSFGQYIYSANSNGYIDPTAGVLFGPVQFIDIYYTNIEEQAAFSELTWDVTDKLKLIGGVRAFSFQHSFQPYEPIAFVDAPGPGLGPKTTTSENSAIGRFNASYSFGKDTLAYLQIAQGYRPGGSNDQGGASIEHVVIPSSFNSDSLINYEIGYKQAAFNRRLTVTGAFYYIDWHNIQEQLQAPVPGAAGATFPFIGNGGGARVYGTELVVDYKPIDRLTLGVTSGFTDAKITRSVPGGGNTGDQIPYVPRFTASLSADYAAPVTAKMKAFIGADGSWTDARATDFPENTATYYVLPTNTIVNFHLGLMGSNWKSEFLVKNVFNNNTFVDVFTVLPGLTTPGYIPNPPRMLWLQFTKSFK
jgi:iron complex outermembrane receptor protein